jgi:hypothetical protein
MQLKNEEHMSIVERFKAAKVFFLLWMLIVGCKLCFAQDTTTSMLPMRPDIKIRCPVSFSVPKIFLQGNGSVSGGGGLPTGCEVTEYYLTDQNLTPDEASKRIEFSIRATSLEKTLTDNNNDEFVTLDRKGVPKVNKKYDFDFGACPSLATHKVSEVSGENWHGWIIESVFRKPVSTRAKKFCPESSDHYQCINMAIGNDKASAVLHPRCFLRGPDNTLHTEMSYEMFMEMMKTWRFKE